MKKTMINWQVGGFVFTAVAGTLLHFLFDWSHGSVVVAVFSAVNESIWEHLKLLFYPMTLFAIIEYLFWGKNTESFWCIKGIGSLVGLLMIPVIYYTYTGSLGIKADWFNIAIFFITAGVVCWLEIRLLQQNTVYPIDFVYVIILLGLMAGVFAIFTFFPPHIPLFQDPVTGSYGFQ